MTPRRYKPIHARDVAAALVRAAVEDKSGVRVIESADMQPKGEPLENDEVSDVRCQVSVSDYGPVDDGSAVSDA